ncbi:MAG: hypothetical protein IJ830_06325 [Alphaproteobacteria bacterium]|nr:hypothetical protein [Alphaproteobacteria bacterium]
MDMLKLAKHGINPTSITSASQAARIFDGINAEEMKEFKEKQAQRQLDEQRHREAIELQQKSLELSEKSMKLAEDANKKSSTSNRIAIISTIIAFVSAIIALIALFK